jgi:hypothetical protein
MSYIDMPLKPLTLASAFAASSVRVLVKPGLAICGMRWVKISSSVSLQELWSRAPSVWGGASTRGSGQTTFDGGMQVVFFLGGIIRVFCRARKHGGHKCWD